MSRYENGSECVVFEQVGLSREKCGQKRHLRMLKEGNGPWEGQLVPYFETGSKEEDTRNGILWRKVHSWSKFREKVDRSRN